MIVVFCHCYSGRFTFFETMSLFTKPIKLRLLFLVHKATVCSVHVPKMRRQGSPS